MLCVGHASAQGALVHKGSKSLSIGLGFKTSWDEYGDKIKMPPLSASLDFGVADNVTIGPYVAVSSTSGEGYGDFVDTQTGNISSAYYTYTYSHKLVGLRGTYNLPVSDKLSAYAGAMLGYHFAKVKYTHSTLQNATIKDAKGNELLYNFFIAGKYALSPNASAFAELGYGVTFLNIGVAIKLK
ncbi:MAG: hypothetical protein JWP69_568 [Flaviaesturariibacter sp.]|nr:hypothetical protein [Flaviaesturariibacter sp.]